MVSTVGVVGVVRLARALAATVVNVAGVLGVSGVAGLVAARHWERSRVAYSPVRRSAGLPPLGSLAGRPGSLLGGLFVGRPPARGSGGVEQPALEVVTIVKVVKVVVVEVNALRVVEAGVIMVAVVWGLGVVAAAVAAGVQAHGVVVITGIAGVVVVA